MRSELDKAQAELKIFMRFASASKLPILPGSVQKRLPPEPDILCEIQGRGYVAFELVELCDANWAQSTSLPADKIPVYLRTSDPTSRIAAKKAKKSYQTLNPIELLCYIDGAIFTPVQIVFQAIQTEFLACPGVFRRVWLLDKKSVYEVWHKTKI